MFFCVEEQKYISQLALPSVLIKSTIQQDRTKIKPSQGSFQVVNLHAHISFKHTQKINLSLRAAGRFKVTKAEWLYKHALFDFVTWDYSIVSAGVYPEQSWWQLRQVAHTL